MSKLHSGLASHRRAYCYNCPQCPSISLASIATQIDVDLFRLNANTTISKCQTLTIPVGQALLVDSNHTLTNNGKINILNNGFDYAELGVFNGGIFINNGLVYNFGLLVVDINMGDVAGGTITNTVNGKLYNSGYLIMQTENPLNNYGLIVNSGGIYNNGSSLINYNAIDNLSEGTIENNPSGTISNYQTFLNSGTVTCVGGSIFNNFNSTYNYYSFTNSATFNNYGGLTNTIGAIFTTSNILTNYAGSTITNNGTIINTDTIINVSGATVYNYNNGIITNNDTFTNNGNVYSPTVDAGCGVGTLNGTSPVTATGTNCPPP